jgi:ferritin
MLSKELEKEINVQINKELYSAYFYLAMAAWCDDENLEGFSNFFKAQAEEEVAHAMKFYGYMNERGNRVVLDAIDKPKSDFKDLEEIFALGLEHEKYVTGRIYELVNLAIKEKDHASKTFLDWYVSEQVEEEASFDGILKKIRLIGKTGHGLLMLDSQVGQRTPQIAAKQAEE